ncbi:TonB-dependent receptor domain-containing protein [Aquimarina hainanensis]|uniref:TonB-dependent receptor domain-containing protein n=1 Tax=Aquimarina hainanensis TaxID=1578017 RepID=A0ABW5N8U9_9FLAO
MIRLLLLIMSILWSQFVCSQSISGVVKDSETQAPIPYATVVLKKETGAFLKGGITDDDGNYFLEIKAGRYMLEIEFMGYQKFSLNVEVKGALKKDITLLAEVSSLDEVVVVGEKTTVTQLIDKKVINVGKDILAAGGSASQVLEQLSDISTDQNGNISLRGSQNVNVLVNGKPSPLSVNELLRQIPANEINKVEVITSPSAKYRANGLTGIINIITNKKVQKGVNFNADIGGNTLGGYNAGVSLGYGKEKVNYKVGGSYRKLLFEGDGLRERIGENPFEQKNHFDFNGDVFRFNTGLDWFPNKNNEFSLGVDFTDNSHDINTNFIEERGEEVTSQRTLNPHIHKTLNYGFNYRHFFNNQEHFFEIDAKLSDNKNDLRNTIVPEGIIADNQIINNVFISNVSGDYNVPINDELKLEAGYLWEFQRLDSKSDEENELGVLENVNQLINDQETHAAYVILTTKLYNVDIQGGLRAEDYKNTGDFVLQNTRIKNNFFNVFPSLHLSYTYNDYHTIAFGYNKRTSRPGLRQLNPLTTQGNQYAVFVGNPDLEPEFSDNMELSYQFKKGIIEVYPSVYFRLKKNFIQTIRFLNEEGVTVTTVDNIGKTEGYGGSLSMRLNPTKWLDNDLSFNYNREESRNDATVAEEFFNDYRENYNITFRNQIKLSKKLRANATWNYQGESKGFYSTSRQVNYVSAGVRYKMLDGRMNLNVTLDDVFNQRRYRNRSFGSGFYENSNYKPLSRIVSFSCTYNFRSGDIKKRNKKQKQYESGVMD